MRRALVSPIPALVAVAAVATFAACSSPSTRETTSASNSAATAFANDQPAYDFFVSKGLTNFQAAGVVGNLDQESGVDPGAVQSGGPGRGIAQWSAGGRWDTDPSDNVVAYAAQQGQSATSLNLQMAFIWYELETYPDYGLAALRASTNVTQATVAFETDFEGCGTCDEATRVSYAEDVLKAYGSTPVPTDAGREGAASDGAIEGDGGDGGTKGELPDAASPGDEGDSGSTIRSSAPAAGPDDPASGCSVSRRPARGACGYALLAIGMVALRMGRRRRG